MPKTSKATGSDSMVIGEISARDDRPDGRGAGARRLRSKVAIVALAVGSALLGGVLVPAGRAVASQLTNVFVTNDNAHPVPVSGTVSVGNIPAMQQIAGTVHLDSNQVEVTNPVAVGGTVAVAPALPVETFEAAVNLRFGANSGNGCLNCDDQVLYDVPDGKVAVIQQVSISSIATEHLAPVYSITWAAGFAPSHFIETTYVDTDELGRRVSVGSQPMTIYAPSQTGDLQHLEVFARVVADFTGPPGYSVTATVRVSGYLVDAPPAG